MQISAILPSMLDGTDVVYRTAQTHAQHDGHTV